MNDAATATDLTKQGCRGARGGSSIEARGILLGWSRRRAAALRGELTDAWQAFHAAEKFW
jgi:hypothetical protein